MTVRGFSVTLGVVLQTCIRASGKKRKWQSFFGSLSNQTGSFILVVS